MHNRVSENTNIFQLNTHKSNISLSTLIDTKFKSNRNIALIQEPPQCKGIITWVPPPLACLYSSPKPRAAIIHNPSLEVWQLPHLSDGDCQTAIWRIKNCKPIIIISAYWDISCPEIQITLKKAEKEALKLKYDLLVGIDSNAHHPIWGSPEANVRGEALVTFLSNNNLNILNKGNNPTFTRINCATHIDITITNTRFISKIKKWKILNEDMFSDHLCLHTIVGRSTTYTKSKLNFKKTNWAIFKDLLDHLEWPLTTLKNQTDIDTAVAYLTDNIMNTITQITPKTYITGKHKKDKWWNEDLRQMRRDLRVARNSQEYPTLKMAYQKAIRKAKKESWRSFLDSCKTMSDTSKLVRIITKPKAQTSGLTIKPDGSPTWSNVTSIKNIIENLFPESSTKPSTKPSIKPQIQSPTLLIG
jgi:hypothetical protein